ncbi:MAG TPA: GH92 family glycosyl hydrolase [Bacteroidales bacterium]|nr:GH92 family glycosyl hydrolase [Bacteroidales bacterium]
MSMLRLFLFSIISAALLTGCCIKEQEPVDLVNPYIGNISHLLVPTYPTVHRPNSMLRFYPDRADYTAYRMPGFPLNIISHRSGKIFGITPFTGNPGSVPVNISYIYDNEKITPYYYKVTLTEPDIKVEFTPEEKAGFFRIGFPGGSDAGIILRTTGQGELSLNDDTVIGFDTFNGVKTWLWLEFDREPNSVSARRNDTLLAVNSIAGNRVALYASFGREQKPSEIKVRYGISYISAEQAKSNLYKSSDRWNFESIVKEGREIWNNTLSKIETEGGTHNQQVVFYTSLYRCFERMIDITEDGWYYSPWTGKPEPAGDTAYYTDDWVWDTHLALHPLQVILNPSLQDEKINSYIRSARQSGWMPTFPVVTGDNHAMNGNHFAAVVLDAWNKDIRGFSLEEAYNHLKKTIMEETKLPWVKGPATVLDKFYDEKGWFPGLKKGEAETVPEVHSFEKRQSVAVTLASSYDDWCMAQMAKALGKEDDYEFFRKRSLNYRNLFNTATGFYHPKDSEGNWIEPFDYRFDGGLGARDYYDENNGWTYIWQPYHAFDDLINMMGGPEKFDEKLDLLFTVPLGRSKWQYYAVLPDATGNVGQFVMGNEPSMHIPYLYNLVGKPWKTQKRIRMLLNTWFRNDLMGIPGDEDGGGLSAFYVFSAMGFYPITPGIPEYQIGSPLFRKIKIHLDNGKTFTIVAENNSDECIYIQSAKLNGKDLNKTSITHNDIIGGGKLVLKMGEKPGHNWGRK